MIIGIVGLGLIGGSMARSIKKHTGYIVRGSDIDGRALAAARRCGAVDEPLTEENIAACDLIFTAIAPRATIQWARQYGSRISPRGILIDLCGIKRSLQAALGAIAGECGFTYIGGHPMAGRERGGFAASTDDLFDGASMILTPGEWAGGPLLERLRLFFTAIGFAELTVTTPEEHDRVIAYTSQLAHIASSAYIKSPEALCQRGLSAGSFRDLTRVARLDPDIWTELMMDNADFLTEQLERYIENLSAFLAALQGGDAAQLHRLREDGCEKKILGGGS